MCSGHHALKLAGIGGGRDGSAIMINTGIIAFGEKEGKGEVQYWGETLQIPSFMDRRHVQES